MALEFSKPIRLRKNHVPHANLATIPLRVDPAGAGVAPETRAVAAPPKVLITDDQALFRAGLARLMAADARLRVINATDDGLDTVERALQLTPDVVLMDLQVPSMASVDPMHGINPQSSTFKVVVLAADFDQETIRALQKNGSSGSLGQDIIPDGVVSRILALYASKNPVSPTRKPEVSERELSVLLHVAAGQSNKQIVMLLGISQKTVRNHLSRIFHKLGVNNRTEAVMNAMRLGLLTV